MQCFLKSNLSWFYLGFKSRNSLLSYCKLCSKTLLALFTEIKEQKDSSDFSIEKRPSQCRHMGKPFITKEVEPWLAPSFSACVLQLVLSRVGFALVLFKWFCGGTLTTSILFQYGELQHWSSRETKCPSDDGEGIFPQTTDPILLFSGLTKCHLPVQQGNISIHHKHLHQQQPVLNSSKINYWRISHDTRWDAECLRFRSITPAWSSGAL